MSSLRSKGSIFKFYSYLPLIILLISVLNEFDFNYLNLKYFSFNFPFILIFYFTLKDFRYFDYSFVFIAGFLHFFPGEELLIYFLSGIGPPVIPSPFFWHY